MTRIPSDRTLLINLATITATIGAFVWLAASAQFEKAQVYVVGAVLFGLLVMTELRLHRSGEGGRSRFRFYFAFLPILLYLIYTYIMTVFGYFDWSAVLLHADGGLMTPGVVWDYIKHSGPTILLMVGLLIGFGILKARGSLTRTADLILMGFVLITNPMVTGPIKAAVYTDPLSGFLSQRYVDISPLATPSVADAAPQKNLVHIFIESAERTYLHEDEFGDVMKPLLPFEKRGLSATNLVEVEYTRASIAGMVAANCGIPLMMQPFMTKRYLEQNGEFLPGVTCLGDVLKQRGYEQSLVSGWPMAFTGQGVFYGLHGYTGLYGGPEVNAAVPGDQSSYGADDAQVLEMGYRLIAKARRKGKPFSITLAVTGGHATDGYLTKRCEGKTGLPANQPNILHAVKCTNMLIAEMLNKAEADGMLDNTVVVLQSDHLSHPSTVSDRLNKYERRNFFSISGSGIVAQTYDGLAGTPDIFPTILEALDMPLPNGRAGLAASMFNNHKTMVKELGQPLFDQAVRADTVLKKRFWDTNRSSVAAVE